MANESSVHTVVDREKTAPFLIRTFVKISGFHRPSLFEDGTLPTTDEHQLFTWRDATLPELISTLRITSPTPEFRHPLAKFYFRALYADSASRGHFSQKDMGQISSREMLDEVEKDTSMGTTTAAAETTSENKSLNKTLEELRFVPGDYLCIAVHLPKNVNLGSGPTSGLSIKGTATAAADTNGKWARGGAPVGPPGGLGRGGAHWRARPGIAAPVGRGGPPGGDDDRAWRGRDRDPPPPPRARRDSPPRPRPPIPERDFEKARPRRRSRTRSRSRSPRRRPGRY
ncbi:hypothetical protein Clacol_001180 [Clathrus columnatus]|uniref:Uncharacterized protein n=1 Tax=Clathrus columnatus TaxID=1419009 RepID=A0AAV5A0A9_9AGAM|nr:hypothetical protein Clacol_001180 [Clathrus columnatus]